MVLAAGLGTRLWPLTEDRAKPAVPFLGSPLVARLVAHLARVGFERVVVNTHHRPESVRAALADAPVEVAFSHEAEILGTAGALAHARAAGLLEPDLPLLVVNGKLETDLDPRPALAAHAAADAAVTMVLLPNPAKEAFREVKVVGDRVVGFGAGRSPESEAPLLFTGIHVLAPEVLRAIPEGFSDTVADVYPPFIAAGRVLAHVAAGGRWWEFSTLTRYLELHLEAHRLGLGPDVVCSPGAQVAPGADVAQAVLWEGATVAAGARVRRAVLGAGVAVAAGEVVEDAVVVRADRVHGPAVGGEHGTRWGERIRAPIPRGAP
jgi:mannose-1-phosphate guanylyltransferase